MTIDTDARGGGDERQVYVYDVRGLVASLTMRAIDRIGGRFGCRRQTFQLLWMQHTS